jgi:peptidoglycan/LPS O-acetylase OafA/YrhL
MAQGSRFAALDSWRGICALFVVLFHFVSMLPSSLAASAFVRNAYLFVDFFFVLSGFVLCHGYRGKIGTPLDIGRFALRRLARVWPLHAVVLSAFVLTIAAVNSYPHPDQLTLTPHGHDYPLDALLPNLLLLNAVGLQPPVWNGPAWSIGAEFYVYLLFALVLLTAPRRLVPVSVALSLAALAVLVYLAPDLMNSTWDYGMVRCIAGFFAGVLAYHGYERLRRFGVLQATLGELAAVALVALFVIAAGNGPDDVWRTSLLAPLVFGVAVVVFAREGGLMSLLILRTRPFRALGRYSFSIYMLHQPLLIALCYGLWRAGLPTKVFGGPVPDTTGSPDLLMADFVLGVILIAAASYRFVETPARGRLNALTPRILALLLARGGIVADALRRLPLGVFTASARRVRSRA